MSAPRPSVAVIGGGYAGVAVAGALDADADVVLVEPRETFVHNLGALRALVDPGFLPRIFLPYDDLLDGGRVVQARATEVGAGRVVLDSGERLEPDYVVLATGSAYPFPAKTDASSAEEAIERYRDLHRELAAAESVLLLGAGPVGLELAGEISAAWPQKRVVLADLEPEILPGPYRPELRAELRRQLEERGVELLLDSGGAEPEADLRIACHGVSPVTDYLAPELAAARNAEGFLETTPELLVRGQDAVFAIGDLVAGQPSMAVNASQTAAVAAANVLALSRGEALSSHAAGERLILVPLGPNGGAGQLPGEAGILGAAEVAEKKGRSLLLENFEKKLRAAVVDAA